MLLTILLERLVPIWGTYARLLGMFSIPAGHERVQDGQRADHDARQPPPAFNPPQQLALPQCACVRHIPHQHIRIKRLHACSALSVKSRVKLVS